MYYEKTTEVGFAPFGLKTEASANPGSVNRIFMEWVTDMGAAPPKRRTQEDEELKERANRMAKAVPRPATPGLEVSTTMREIGRRLNDALQTALASRGRTSLVVPELLEGEKLHRKMVEGIKYVPPENRTELRPEGERVTVLVAEAINIAARTKRLPTYNM